MLKHILVQWLRPSRDFSVFGQWFELTISGMVCPHVLVLLCLLISHLLSTICTVDEPGVFDLESPGIVQQELGSLFLLHSDETWPWECSRAGLLLNWLSWWIIVEDLPILVPVSDIEEVIEDTLLQLSHHCDFRGSLQLVPILLRDLGCLCNWMCPARPSRVADGL